MLLNCVTTIIPVFNRPTMLRSAVESVMQQTHAKREVVIVDDGSTDETSDVIAQLVSECAPTVQALHQENRGPGSAREAGLRIARGEFIQFLDSDDLLLPEKFSLQIAALREMADCGIAYGWTRLVVNGVSAPRPWKRTGERIDRMFPSMLESRWWATPTPLYRAELLREIGPWTDLRAEEDWEYDCRIAASGVKLAYVEAWVSESIFHGDQLSVGPAAQRPSVLHDRARAHALIMGHARQAGIASNAPEMQHFVRELFLLGRQCGAAGLSADSAALVELALTAVENAKVRTQLRIYRSLARFAGWTTAGRIAAALDRLH